jgi:hypothetical protein
MYIYTSEHFAARWNDSSGVPLTQAEVETGLKLLELIGITMQNSRMSKVFKISSRQREEVEFLGEDER